MFGACPLYPKSGHRNLVVECPLCAKSRHCAMQQNATYSVTSSKQRVRHIETERLGSFQVDNQFVLVRRGHWLMASNGLLRPISGHSGSPAFRKPSTR